MNSWIVTPCSLWFRIVCPSRPFLGSSVLALPLELCRRQEVVFVLERFDVVFLVERYEQEDMLPLTYETLPPKALGIRQSIEGCNICPPIPMVRNSSHRVGSHRSERPFVTLSLQGYLVPRSWLSGVVTEPLLQHLGKNVLVAARSSDNIDRNLHEVGIQSFIINSNVGPAFGQIGMLRRLVNCLTLCLLFHVSPCRSAVLCSPHVAKNPVQSELVF